MKPFLLAVALLGASFSGLTIHAQAGGAPGGAVGGHRLVTDYQSGGEEIPSKR